MNEAVDPVEFVAASGKHLTRVVHEYSILVTFSKCC